MAAQSPAKDSISFPTLVREIRRARQLTQEQLARELQVTFSTVNGWENGKHRPIPVLAKRLLEMAADSNVPSGRFTATSQAAKRKGRKS
jgi:transcriptional regulator with XRE-family HTH domain